MIHGCLGETIDIHGGGNDLVFPHHENELAQSCCALGTKKLARHWVHNGHVTLEGNKMAKSKGNVFLLGDALDIVPGEAVRYALLAAHYRKPLDWGVQKLRAARAALSTLYRSLGEGIALESEGIAVPAEFLDAMKDDLDTPRAMALMHGYSAAANRAKGDGAKEARQKLAAAGSMLGFFNSTPEEWAHMSATVEEGTIEDLILERDMARKERDFQRADEIRAQIESQGVVIEDTASGDQVESQMSVGKSSSFAARMALFAISSYKKTVSPVFKAFGVRCRFYPSCSQYACEALEKARVFPWHSACHRPSFALPSLL